MRFFVLSGRSTLTNASLVAAARGVGLEAHPVSPHELGDHAVAGDVVLARLDVRPTLDGVEDGLVEVRRAARAGVDVLNEPGALFAAHDKLATAIHLARYGIPHPRTAHVGGCDETPSIAPPVVVKPRFGSWGRDVLLCRTPAELHACLRKLRRRSWFRRQGALVQELVPPLGYDLRVVVAGGEVVGAVRRVAASGEWRTNVALGARRLPTEPPADARAVALAAAAAVGADLVGVDLLPLPGGGFSVLELNAAVDFTSAYSLDGRDVFAEVVRLLVPVAEPAVALELVATS